ncbi:MAG: VOC family protein [Actinomycetota bacterium]|nr:VOC family protein [Actinomycetota bacterium]
MTEQVRAATATMFPFARYNDGKAAIAWLCNAFGFEPREVHEGEDGTIVHAELVFGASVFMLDSKPDTGLGLKTARELGAVTGGVYVHVEDIDAHYRRTTSAGAEIVRELADTDYGSREYVARDTEGNLWGFGTYRPTL